MRYIAADDPTEAAALREVSTQLKGGCYRAFPDAGSCSLPDTPHRSGRIDAVRLEYSRRVVAIQNSGMADSGGSISVQLSGPLKEYVGSAIASLVG